MTTTMRPRPHVRIQGSERLGSRTMRGPQAPRPQTRVPHRAKTLTTPALAPPNTVQGSVLTAIAGLGLFVLGLVTVELRTDVTAEGFATRTLRQEAAEVRHEYATLQTRLEQRLFAER